MKNETGGSRGGPRCGMGYYLASRQVTNSRADKDGGRQRFIIAWDEITKRRSRSRRKRSSPAPATSRLTSRPSSRHSGSLPTGRTSPPMARQITSPPSGSRGFSASCWRSCDCQNNLTVARPIGGARARPPPLPLHGHERAAEGRAGRSSAWATYWQLIAAPAPWGHSPLGCRAASTPSRQGQRIGAPPCRWPAPPLATNLLPL
jgi:hypothetical protein